jgi:hypothetical protein
LLAVAGVAGCRGDDAGGRTKADDQRVAKLERFLKDTFCGGWGQPEQPWCRDVGEIDVRGTAATVNSELGTDTDGKNSAKQICIAVIGSDQQFSEARVISSGDELLYKC